MLKFKLLLFAERRPYLVYTFAQSEFDLFERYTKLNSKKYLRQPTWKTYYSKFFLSFFDNVNNYRMILLMQSINLVISIN